MEWNFRTRANIALNALFRGKSGLNTIFASFGNEVGWSKYGNRQAQLLRAYSYLPWLRATLGKVADGVSAAPWYLEAAKRGGKYQKILPWANSAGAHRKRMRAKVAKRAEINEILDHPLLDLLANPNEMISGPSLMSLAVLHLDLVGEALWWMEMEPTRFGVMPKKIWPVPPGWIDERPKDTYGNFTLNVDDFPGGKVIPLSECVWFRDPDPASPYKHTIGCAGPLTDEMESDEYASKFLKGFFLNRARPDILISGTGLTQEEADRAEERWLGKLRGYMKQFRPHFMGAEVQVHQLGGKLNELQIIELRKWQRDVVFQVVGIPPEINGVLESSNRATIDTANFIFARWVLVPRLERIRAGIQQYLIPLYDDKLVAEYSSPVEEDREYLLKVMSTAPWWFTGDEWRASVGLNPLQDEQGDILMIPGAYVPTKASEVSEFVSPYTQQQGGSGPPPEEEDDKEDSE